MNAIGSEGAGKRTELPLGDGDGEGQSCREEPDQRADLCRRSVSAAPSFSVAVPSLSLIPSLQLRPSPSPSPLCSSILFSLHLLIQLHSFFLVFIELERQFAHKETEFNCRFPGLKNEFKGLSFQACKQSRLNSFFKPGNRVL